MSTLEVPIDVLAEFFHRVHSDETVADTIDCFHKEHGYDHCNNCGGPATECCANCKTMRYCSNKCLEEDWLRGGHQAECKAIRERLPWKSLAHEVLTDKAPSEDSITGRHLMRLLAARNIEEETPKEVPIEESFLQFHDSIGASLKSIVNADPVGWNVAGPKTRYDLSYASWMSTPGKTIRRSHHTVEGLWVTHAFLTVEHARALKEKNSAKIEASDKAKKGHLEDWRKLLGDDVRLAMSNLMSVEDGVLRGLINSMTAQQDESSRSVMESVCYNLANVFAPLMNPRFEAAGRNEFRQAELRDAMEVTQVRLAAMFRTYAAKFQELGMVTALKGPDSEGFYWAAWSLVEECKGQGMRLRYYIRKDALLLTDRLEEVIEDHHLNALQGELIGSKGGHWIQKAIKHPGRLTRAANRADHGHYKGHTMAFARHVAHGHGKHEHKGLKKAANLAITLSKMNHHHHK